MVRKKDRMRILVVDDLPFMRSIISDIVTESGHVVIGEAGDGIECLSRYKSLLPDLVLLDIVMPRMNGVEALKSLKKVYPNSKVIMCSSLSDQEKIIQAIRLGASDYIVKPFQRKRLVSAINRARSVND
jgi:two-component system, chemotaxis family, chemotaxis protein CheY